MAKTKTADAKADSPIGETKTMPSGAVVPAGLGVSKLHQWRLENEPDYRTAALDPPTLKNGPGKAEGKPAGYEFDWTKTNLSVDLPDE